MNIIDLDHILTGMGILIMVEDFLGQRLIVLPDLGRATIIQATERFGHP